MRASGGEKAVLAGARGFLSAVALAALAGCSSIPDEMNPGTWVSGASDWVSGVFSGPSDQSAPAETPPAPVEQPKLGNDERPKGEPPAERDKVEEGLAADRANAHYTEAEQKREGTPTRPLNESAGQAATPDQSSAPAAVPAPAPAPAKPAAPPSDKSSDASPPPPAPAPAPAPKPLSTSAAPASTQTAAAEPPPEPDTSSVVAPSARVKMSDDQASMPAPAPKPLPAPQTAAQTPPPAPAAPKPAPAPVQAAAEPPPAPAPAATPAPEPKQAQAAPPPRAAASAGNGDLVAKTYRERLAEFTAGSAAPTRTAYAGSSAARDNGVMSDSTAIPNSKVTPAHGSGGAHPLSALDQHKAAASFQMAQIVFGEGTAALAPADEAPLRAVADVYRDSKGAAKIGVVGHSNSQRLDVSASANRESNRSLAAERAAAVARALEKIGVPANKIYAGATGETAGDYAEVFVSY